MAGLVLGAIPLVVVALRHYEACEDKVKIFCYWRKHLDKTCRTLLLLHSSYKMTIETVLQPITNAAELEEMLAQPGCLLWHSPSIKDSLQSSLRNAYVSFLDLTFEINTVVEELLNHLDLDRHTGVSKIGLLLILSLQRRFQFAAYNVVYSPANVIGRAPTFLKRRSAQTGRRAPPTGRTSATPSRDACASP